MDELVERCLVEASRVSLDWVSKADSEQEPLAHVVARAIIPIVQDWQRERDAGIAERLWSGENSEYGAGIDSACERIATAIRNQEQTDGR